MDFRGGAGADSFLGGSGNDTAYGFAGDDILQGEGGDDVLVGHDGNDTLNGGAGDDWLVGGAGKDQMNGMEGIDWVSYEDAVSKVTVDLTLGWQDTGGGGTDRMVGIENLYGSIHNDSLLGDAGANTLSGQLGDDILDGRAGNDVLNGGAGKDSLLGGDGDDILNGGAGDDSLNGGAGIDWASYEGATSAVSVDLLLTTAQNTGGAGLDRLLYIENLAGSVFGDSLSGNTLANSLRGLAGDDVLYGRGGNDVIEGGAGWDWLVGGLGNDTIDGGGDIDWASYEDASKGVTVSLAITGAQNTLGAGTDILSGIENLYGSAFGDILTGDAGANRLHGAEGNDKLYGGEGDDTLAPGIGQDLIDGGAGIDTVSYDGAATGVFVQLWNATTQETGVGAHTFVGIENIYGSAQRDFLWGDASVNWLAGAGGDDYLNSWGSGDTLEGGAGDDVLTGTVGVVTLLGGEGSDTFVMPYNGKAATIDLAKAGAQVVGGDMTFTLDSIENITTRMGNDTIWVSTAQNDITTGTGTDKVIWRSLAEIGKGEAGGDHILDWASGDTLDVSRIDANTKVAGNQAFVWASAFTGQAGQMVASWDAATGVSHVAFDVNGDKIADADLYLHGAQAQAYGWLL